MCVGGEGLFVHVVYVHKCVVSCSKVRAGNQMSFSIASTILPQDSLSGHSYLQLDWQPSEA